VPPLGRRGKGACAAPLDSVPAAREPRARGLHRIAQSQRCKRGGKLDAPRPARRITLVHGSSFAILRRSLAAQCRSASSPPGGLRGVRRRARNARAREEGIEVRSSGDGYRLATPFDALDAETTRAGLGPAADRMRDELVDGATPRTCARHARAKVLRRARRSSASCNAKAAGARRELVLGLGRGGVLARVAIRGAPPAC
jgi:hypothetical protein